MLAGSAISISEPASGANLDGPLGRVSEITRPVLRSDCQRTVNLPRKRCKNPAQILAASLQTWFPALRGFHKIKKPERSCDAGSSAPAAVFWGTFRLLG
jgi:hypothetical protein